LLSGEKVLGSTASGADNGFFRKGGIVSKENSPNKFGHRANARGGPRLRCFMAFLLQWDDLNSEFTGDAGMDRQCKLVAWQQRCCWPKHHPREWRCSMKGQGSPMASR